MRARDWTSGWGDPQSGKTCKIRCMAHASDSTPQRLAERALLDLLQAQLGATFIDGATLPMKLGVKPDGIDPERKIVVEVFARIGRNKAAQDRKVRADLFKLAYIRQALGAPWRAVFCFADPQAAASTLGRSWAASAARTFGVEICVVELPDDLRAQLLATQVKQRMVNAP